jgi:hypothetical protein
MTPLPTLPGAALLLPLSFGLLLLIRVQHARFDRPGALRTCVLEAAWLWGMLATLISEGLSLGRALTPDWIAASWSAATVGALLLWALGGGWRSLPSRRLGRLRLAKPGRPAWSMVSASLALLAVGGLTGLAAAASLPNTWDAMVYHLSRVMHWLQNGSLDYFPTHIYRQLNMTPFAEYVFLQLHALSGGDRFDNLPQWLALLGSLSMVSHIALRLGAGRQGQLLTAVVCATIASGILQASGPQNDYVAALWLAGFAYYTLTIWQEGITWRSGAGAGATLGLAALTKGTAYFVAGPLLLWYPLALLRARSLRAIGPLVLSSVLFVALNSGFYWRNFVLFGDPLGGHAGLKNELRTPPGLASNLLRNAALHLALPSDEVNASINLVVSEAHAWLGISTIDPRTTILALNFRAPYWSTNELVAGSTLHALLIAAALVCLSFRRFRRGRLLVPYAGTVLLSWLLFSVLLKWQPQSARLQLPAFVLASPLVGLVLSRWGARGLQTLLPIVLLVASLPFLLNNERRPVQGERPIYTVPPAEQYFFPFTRFMPVYEQAARWVSGQGCDDIGIYVWTDFWEYPLWTLIPAETGRPVRIKHVFVHNGTVAADRNPGYEGFEPCALLVADVRDARVLIDRVTSVDKLIALCREQFTKFLDCDILSRDYGDQRRLTWNGAVFERQKLLGSRGRAIRAYLRQGFAPPPREATARDAPGREASQAAAALR